MCNASAQLPRPKHKYHFYNQSIIIPAPLPFPRSEKWKVLHGAYGWSLKVLYVGLTRLGGVCSLSFVSFLLDPDFVIICADKGFSNLWKINVEFSHMLSNINPCLLIDIHNNATIGTFYIAHGNEIMDRKQKAVTCAVESQRGGRADHTL